VQNWLIQAHRQYDNERVQKCLEASNEREKVPNTMTSAAGFSYAVVVSVKEDFSRC
jgi:hypothetical protein